MKTTTRSFYFILVAMFVTVTANAQSTKKQKKADEIKTLVNSVNYIFKANFMSPLSGGGKVLNDDYDLTIKKDTIISYLPYYGTAYTAPTNPYSADGYGIQFKTTNFVYSVKEGKNGSWDVLIKPKNRNITDMRDVQTMRLSITSGGYATLYVNNTNRDPISFNGIIEAAAK